MVTPIADVEAVAVVLRLCSTSHATPAPLFLQAVLYRIHLGTCPAEAAGAFSPEPLPGAG